MDVLTRPQAAESQMKSLLTALNLLKRGDSSVRLPSEWTGLSGKVAEAFNDLVELNERIFHEFAAVHGQRITPVGRRRVKPIFGDPRGAGAEYSSADKPAATTDREERGARHDGEAHPRR